MLRRWRLAERDLTAMTWPRCEASPRESAGSPRSGPTTQNFARSPRWQRRTGPIRKFSHASGSRSRSATTPRILGKRPARVSQPDPPDRGPSTDTMPTCGALAPLRPAVDCSAAFARLRQSVNEMTTPTELVSPSHPREGTGNVGKRWVVKRRKPAAPKACRPTTSRSRPDS